jgi:hypothetical protein
MAAPIGANILNKAARGSPVDSAKPLRETTAMHKHVAIMAKTVAQEKFAKRILGSGLPSPFADGPRRKIYRKARLNTPFPCSHAPTAPTGIAHPARNEASNLTALRNPSERNK